MQVTHLLSMSFSGLVMILAFGLASQGNAAYRSVSASIKVHIVRVERGFYDSLFFSLCCLMCLTVFPRQICERAADLNQHFTIGVASGGCFTGLIGASLKVHRLSSSFLLLEFVLSVKNSSLSGHA